MSHQEAFLALVRAGLWELANENENQNEKRLEGLDWGGVIRLSEEQSVVGIVAAGVEKLPAGTLPLTEKLTLLGKCQLVEQQNVAMNQFVAKLVAQMREAGIDVVLVKGQGVAQCFEKPMWRSCGDVDFLLDEENYEKAKVFLKPLASSTGKESAFNKHSDYTIDSWTVELHSNMRCGLSDKMDSVLDEIQEEVCGKGQDRTWMNGYVPVNLPAPNEDVVFVFTHFLKHFYKGGLGLRQICDWCRLLWTYRNDIDVAKLEGRLQKMRVVTEWMGFASFAVEVLGMPEEAMPIYDPAVKWKRKANKILVFILRSGNFGHNRDMSYFGKYPYMIRKVISLKQRLSDLFNHARIFSINTIRFAPVIMYNGLRSAARGE